MAVAVLLAAPVNNAAAAEQRLLASGGAASDDFGTSVAVDGDTAVVGAPNDDQGRGSVFVFARFGNTWTQTAKLTATDRALGDALGSSVAIDGDTIVAGARLDDIELKSDQGSVYTFTRTGGNRTETAKLTATDGVVGDNLGVSVAIDGDRIVAGATTPDVGTTPSPGAAYTFTSTGVNPRTQAAKLTASDGAADDRFGISVAIDGDTIVVGANSDDVPANADQGSAYTFPRAGGAQTAKLTASDGAEADNLGFSVAIDGTTIVAGAPSENPGTSGDQGAAYTFTRTGGDRSHAAKLTRSDAAEGDRLGYSVAVDGGTIVAGALQDDFGTPLITNAGSAYTFTNSGGAFAEAATLRASDAAASDEFGSSVAVDGETIVAGSPRDDIGINTSQGSATIFFTAVAAVDTDGDGVPDTADACPTQAAATANGCPAAATPGGGGSDVAPVGTGSGSGGGASSGAAPPPKKACEGLKGRPLASCRTEQKVKTQCGRLKGDKKAVCAKRIRALAKCDQIATKTKRGKARKKACVTKAKAIGKKKAKKR